MKNTDVERLMNMFYNDTLKGYQIEKKKVKLSKSILMKVLVLSLK